MSNINKAEYAVVVLDVLERSNEIVREARNLLYVNFDEVYGEALGEIDYDDFRYNYINIPVFTNDEEDEPIEVVSFENPFAYGSSFATDFDDINYDNYDFRVEEDYQKFLRDVVTKIVTSHTEYNVTADTLDLEVTISAMFEENYGLKDLLPAIFVSDCVSNELGNLASRINKLNRELVGESYLIDVSLIYKPFDNTVFYESSKCW